MSEDKLKPSSLFSEQECAVLNALRELKGKVKDCLNKAYFLFSNWHYVFQEKESKQFWTETSNFLTKLPHPVKLTESEIQSQNACILVFWLFLRCVFSRELITKGQFCNEVELRKCYRFECNLKQTSAPVGEKWEMIMTAAKANSP